LDENRKQDEIKLKRLIWLVEGINDPHPYDTADLIRKIKKIMEE
jgi:hypothetical protein